MSTKEECLKFGRRKGKAIIGVEVTEAKKDSSSSSNASSITKTT